MALGRAVVAVHLGGSVLLPWSNPKTYCYPRPISKNVKHGAPKLNYVHNFGAFIKYMLGHPTSSDMNQVTNEID